MSKRICIFALALALCLCGVYQAAALSDPYDIFGYEEEREIERYENRFLVSNGIVTVLVGARKDLRDYIVTEREEEEIRVAGNMRWVSDKPEVATVDASGVVTAHRYGSAKITLTYEDNWGRDMIQTIRVRAVTSLPEKDAFSFHIEEGQRLDLMELLYPGYNPADGSVSWASNFPHVLEVDEGGRALAVRYGNATVTATFTDADGGSSAQKISFRVDTPGLGSLFKTIAVTLRSGDTVDFGQVLYPDVSLGKTTCATGDRTVAAVDGSTVTAGQAGSCSVRVEYTGPRGDTQSHSVTIRVIS